MEVGSSPLAFSDPRGGIDAHRWQGTAFGHEPEPPFTHKYFIFPKVQ
jgi:hypothetical protein